MKNILVFIIVILTGCVNSNRPLLKIENNQSEYAYINVKGDIIIPFGKYPVCFTDTFKKYAIVLKKHEGFIAINRHEKTRFSIFIFDNGPDDISDGYFRIIKNGKIGYADSNFSIKIKPQYGCAFPFKDGVAKVSVDCKEVSDGEHSSWISDRWFYINKQGHRVKI